MTKLVALTCAWIGRPLILKMTAAFMVGGNVENAGPCLLLLPPLPPPNSPASAPKSRR